MKLKSVFLIFFVNLCFVPRITSFHDGAPCASLENLTPAHGESSNGNSVPFQLEFLAEKNFSVSCYQLGKNLTGWFDVAQNKDVCLQCDEPGAITHRNSLPKHEVNVIWVPSDFYNGLALFNATILTSKEEWYPGVQATLHECKIEDMNECNSSPCHHGGTCHDGLDSYTCNCKSGFIGNVCETDIDECSSKPCLHDGVCKDGANGFTCICPPGYDGVICEYDINVCISSPCQNEGECYDRVHGYICHCPHGYSGDNCEEYDECSSSPCQHGGTCVDKVNKYTCNCAKNFNGTNCENYNDCIDPNICANGGTCHDTMQNFTCTCQPGVTGATCMEVSCKDCADIRKEGETKNGVYRIDPSGDHVISVYCDMQTLGGGWTVFQRRMNGKLNFSRNWIHYKQGFGNVSMEHWLGNEALHDLTKSATQELLVELREGDRSCVLNARYETFYVGNEGENYKLNVGDFTDGSAGDSGEGLSYHNTMGFSTFDRDNDRALLISCSRLRGGDGGWWYDNCGHAKLNGKYSSTTCVDTYDHIYWKKAHGSYYSFSATEMKIRPTEFRPVENHKSNNWCPKISCDIKCPEDPNCP